MALITRNNIKSVINNKETMIVWPIGIDYDDIKSIKNLKSLTIDGTEIFLCKCCDLKKMFKVIKSIYNHNLLSTYFYFSANSIEDTEDLIKEFDILTKSRFKSSFTEMHREEVIEKYC